MRHLNRIVRNENDERARLTLHAMNLMGQVKESTVQARWARELRKTCLQVCHDPRPHPIAFEALRSLAVAPEKEDIDWVAYLITHWPEDLLPRSARTSNCCDDDVARDGRALLAGPVQREPRGA